MGCIIALPNIPKMEVRGKDIRPFNESNSLRGIRPLARNSQIRASQPCFFSPVKSMKRSIPPDGSGNDPSRPRKVTFPPASVLMSLWAKCINALKRRKVRKPNHPNRCGQQESEVVKIVDYRRSEYFIGQNCHYPGEGVVM